MTVKIFIFGILASSIPLVFGQTPNEWRHGSPEATIKDFPFLVSVCDRNKHICGGVILDNYFILTAADCFRKTPHKIRTDLKILAGPDDVVNSNYTGRFYDIYLIIFPDEISGYSPNLAVLKLTSEIEFSAFRQPARLPNKKFLLEYLTTIGWKESTHNNQQYDLQKVYLRSWTDVGCKNYFQNFRIIHPDEVCASPSRGKPAARHMIYSGSPVFNHRKKCKIYTIIGIISVPPLGPSNPLIYVSVFHYVRWIRLVIEEFKN